MTEVAKAKEEIDTNVIQNNAKPVHTKDWIVL
jgi:hypothetical protein